MRDLFHTRIGPALSDASTYGALAAIVTAAVALPDPFRWVVIALGVPGVLLKGGKS
jgi:hypothetical protein